MGPLGNVILNLYPGNVPKVLFEIRKIIVDKPYCVYHMTCKVSFILLSGNFKTRRLYSKFTELRM
jgi:hypothetical protein